MPSTTVKFLQTHPEPVYPARHSWLWRVSKFRKAWENRWFCLDHHGFVYAKTPQGMSLSKPVFSDSSDLTQAHAEDKVLTKDGGTMMWGFTVTCDEGSSVTLYTEDRVLRDNWVRTIHSAIKAKQAHEFIDQRYDVKYDKPLGTGLFAVVLLATERATKSSVAIKVIKSEAYKEYKDLVEREIMVWHAVGYHPNIVKLREVLQSDKRIYFVAELAEGGNLMSRLAATANYCERDVARVMRQVLEGVKHCHEVGIVHADLKPENIVLASKAIDSPLKLIDFSLASFFNTSTEPGGTPEFVAPELLLHPEHYAEKGCGPHVDIWAAGVIAFFLLCGKTPFYAPEMEAIIEKVKSGVWSFAPARSWAFISPEAKDFVARMLQANPTARPSAAQLLEHPYMRGTPAQYSSQILSDALSEFKAHFGEAGSTLRTSWVHRSGVIRHNFQDAYQSQNPGGAGGRPMILGMPNMAAGAAGMQAGGGMGVQMAGALGGAMTGGAGGVVMTPEAVAAIKNRRNSDTMAMMAAGMMPPQPQLGSMAQGLGAGGHSSMMGSGMGTGMAGPSGGMGTLQHAHGGSMHINMGSSSNLAAAAAVAVAGLSGDGGTGSTGGRRKSGAVYDPTPSPAAQIVAQANARRMSERVPAGAGTYGVPGNAGFDGFGAAAMGAGGVAQGSHTSWSQLNGFPVGRVSTPGAETPVLSGSMYGSLTPPSPTLAAQQQHGAGYAHRGASSLENLAAGYGAMSLLDSRSSVNGGTSNMAGTPHTSLIPGAVPVVSMSGMAQDGAKEAKARQLALLTAKLAQLQEMQARRQQQQQAFAGQLGAGQQQQGAVPSTSSPVPGAGAYTAAGLAPSIPATAYQIEMDSRSSDSRMIRRNLTAGHQFQNPTAQMWQGAGAAAGNGAFVGGPQAWNQPGQQQQQQQQAGMAMVPPTLVRRSTTWTPMQFDQSQHE